MFLDIILTNSIFDYKNKNIVITGGSSGIGLEIAKECIKHSSRVVTIIGRNEKKLKKAKEELEIVNNNNDTIINTISLDTSINYNNIENCIYSKIINKFGSIDGLINCAGTSIAGEFEKLPIDEFSNMLKSNVIGSIYPTKVIVNHMKNENTNNNKIIIFTSSQVAQVAIHGYTAYAASKWALRGLAEALQMEVKPYHIYISIAYPPDTDTPGYQEEMLTKPLLTTKLSESGNVFQPNDVAKDIIKQSSKGYFNITTGIDGYLLKLLHPGMSPINNWCEIIITILLCSIARIISLFYIIEWDNICKNHKILNDYNKSDTKKSK